MTLVRFTRRSHFASVPATVDDTRHGIRSHRSSRNGTTICPAPATVNSPPAARCRCVDDPAERLECLPSALAGNGRGVDVESGARLARTQDEGVVGSCVADEETASRVPGRQNAASVSGRGTRGTGRSPSTRKPSIFGPTSRPA